MIKKNFRSDHHALKLGFIEAVLEAEGMYKNKWMANVFGNHEKDAARIIRKYREINPDSTVTEGKVVLRSDSYKRKVLKPLTEAYNYLCLIQKLYGSEMK